MSKFTPEHLGRQAVVYIRQSTADQVANKLESQRRQYNLTSYEQHFLRRARGVGQRGDVRKVVGALKKKRWFIYAKEPFAGPNAVLAYLSRYTHRVAISNSRLIKADEAGIIIRIKNYRFDGDARYMTMMLAPGEFIRHVLPKSFHRIRHTGFLGGSDKASNIEKARELHAVTPLEPASADATENTAATAPIRTCSRCGGAMHIIETFERG
jgi:Putative transposase